MSRADREAFVDKVFARTMAKIDAAARESTGLLRIRSAGLAAGISEEAIAKSQENFLAMEARHKPELSDFDRPVPLPEPDPMPVTNIRGHHTPCTPEELMATFMTALREAGPHPLTVSVSTDPGWHGIEFTWKEAR